MTDVDEFLEHYGVMGMKWGIRNKSKSKYFAPTTKEERKAIRRSPSAREGRKLIGKVSTIFATSVGANYIVRRLVSKKYGDLVGDVSGSAAAFAGAGIAAKILDVNGNRKIKSSNKKKS
jgi:formiminotetrahydrofolate cyclodeaminase